MYIDIGLVKYTVSEFIKYNGLRNHIFTPTNNIEQEITLNSPNNMKMFKHYLVNCAINIMIEWYYDVDIEPDLGNEKYCRDLRCHLLEQIDRFPYEMGYWA